MRMREVISSVVSDCPSQSAVRDLIALFHKFAIVYLRKKASSGSLNPGLFGIPLEDVAFDCITELFCRDARGAFVELQTYYINLNYSSLSDDELMALSRRLVFSKITQDLYRQYRELDPGLHKIIRNLKDAAASDSTISLETRSSVTWLHFCAGFPEEVHRPVMPAEILEAFISPVVSQSANTKVILTALRNVFTEQSTYRRSYPLFGLAHSVRAVFSRLRDISAEVQRDCQELGEDDVARQISETIAAVKTSMRPSYVEKGKLGEDTYEAYFRAVESILHDEFVNDSRQDGSFFEHLARYMGDLSPESYRAVHRVYLEYLMKVTRRQFLDSMKREL